MKFRQPNSRARAMHQAIDQLLAGSAVTLTFQTESETLAGLEALHEVAQVRHIGIRVEAIGNRRVQVRLVEAKAA